MGDDDITKKILFIDLLDRLEEKQETRLIHLLIDPAEGALCDPTHPFSHINDFSKVNCEECRRLWIGG